MWYRIGTFFKQQISWKLCFTSCLIVVIQLDFDGQYSSTHQLSHNWKRNSAPGKVEKSIHVLFLMRNTVRVNVVITPHLMSEMK